MPLIRRRVRRSLAALLVLAVCLPAGARQPAALAQPSLLVLVVVDQMRAEYFTRYGATWTGGLRRLMDHGARFEQAFYPYVNTVTCVGHATLGTGAWPRTHGIILNQWYRRDEHAVRTCTGDGTVRGVAYAGVPDRDGHGPAQLRVPTLAERLRERWPGSRSVTVSLKPRSAIMMAGKGATAVTWAGVTGWQTSTAFSAEPVPAVARAAAAHPVDADREAVWERRRPLATYLGLDDVPGERPQHGWTRVFPHPLTLPGNPPAAYSELWQSSPYGDAALGAMAADALDGFQLGRRDAVDFLGVSFSSTDLVGHDFGPDSHEVQDTLARLDLTLGALLTALDTKVGRDRYVLALSADHGVATIPEVTASAGSPAGRVPFGAVRAAVETALQAPDQAPQVAHVEYTEIYLSDAARDAMTATRVAPALRALRVLPGVAAALWWPDLSLSADVPPAVLDAARASHVPGRSGDITIVPARNWIFVPGNDATGGDATTHGSLHAYDQHVPLVFLGPPFVPGRYEAPVTPADLAPTLAATVGLPIGGIEGRPVPVGTAPHSGPK